MSRNSSGTYTLPSGNPVVSGSVISSAWANDTMNDIATALTDSLSRSGKGGMTAAFRSIDGTISVPGISFSNETGSGLYRAGAGDVRLAILGADILAATASGVAVTGTLSTSGAAILASLGVTGNATVGGNLGVTGTLSITGDAGFVNLAYTGTLTGGTGAINIGSGQITKDASGNVGFSNDVTMADTKKLKFGDGSAYLTGSGSAETLALGTGGADRIAIDSSGDITLSHLPSNTSGFYGNVYVDANGKLYKGATFESRTPSWSYFTASGTFTVPSGVTTIRAYAGGAGGNGNTSAAGGVSNGGGGGGFAYGDMTVTPGQTVTVSISSGVATVAYGGTTLLTANKGGDGGAGGAGTAGTASKHASVTNGGAYSGGAGGVGNGGSGGGSCGSPLGNGYAGGTLGGGGGGIGGAGGNGGGSTGGGGGGAGGAGGAAGSGSVVGGGGGGAGGAASTFTGGPSRAFIARFTDPLLKDVVAAGPSGVYATATVTPGGIRPLPGCGGVGNVSAYLYATQGADFGGGGGTYNNLYSTAIVGAAGGLMGGGGGVFQAPSGGTVTGGAGGLGGGGGSASGTTATGGAGGGAFVFIYA